MARSALSTQSPMDMLPRIRPGEGLNILEGVRVIDLTTSIAGPYATMLLGDFGAEVIKVERPEGDDARHWGPPFLDGESLWFLAVNRNKKSVVLDLTDDRDKDVLRRLVKTADVVVTNQPAQVQAKLGLDYQTLSGLREDIIFTSITGFGLTGARSDMACYDLIAEGYSGIMDLTGAADSPPQKVGAPAADMLAGQDAAMTTLAAIIDRMRTGKGRLIDVSLVESMTRFSACRLSSYLGSGEAPTRSGGTDSVIAIYQSFRTKDEPITLGLGSNGIWKRFWVAVGRPEYADDPTLQSNSHRRANRESIVRDIQAILLTRQRAHWLEAFRAAKVPAGPINSVDQVCADVDLVERGLFAALEDGERVTPHIGLGVQFDGKPISPRAAAPKLGAHTADILAALAPADEARGAPFPPHVAPVG